MQFNFPNFCAAVLYSFFFLLLALRLFFGVEFTDEVFNLSIAHHFHLGGYPYIDEINLAQNSAILTLPLYKLYILIHGDTDGIVLYFRFMYFLLKIITVLYAFYIFKRIVSPFWAFIISFPIFGLSASNIHILFYNSLAANFFLLGLLIFFDCSIRSRARPILYVIAGLCHSITIAVYPTMIIPIFIAFLLFFMNTKEQKIKLIALYSAGGLIIALPFLSFLFFPGIRYLERTLEYANAFNIRSTQALRDLFFHLKHVIVFIPILCFLSLFIKKYFKSMAIIAPLIAFFVSFESTTSDTSSYSINHFMLYWSVINLYLFPIIYFEKNIRESFILLFFPSLIAAGVFAVSSGSGLLSAATGSWPAFVCALYWNIVYLKHAVDIEKNKYKSLVLSFNVLIMIFLLYCNKFIYRDDEINLLTQRVDFGPYKNIFTTPTKYDYIKKLVETAQPYIDNRKKILIYDRFPGAYLLLNGIPCTPTTWLFQAKDYTPPLDRKWLIKYYEDKDIYPDVIIKFKHIQYTEKEINSLVYPDYDEFDIYITNNDAYKKVISTKNYDIFLYMEPAAKVES